jgi:ribose transport system permease protein
MLNSDPGTSQVSSDTLRQKLIRLQLRLPLIQIIALGVVYAYGASALGLGNWLSIKQILIVASLFGLAATGQTLLVLIGGFDLSVSGFIVASALIVTSLHSNWHVSSGIAVLFAAVGGAVLGGLSGTICHRFRIQPLVITLAMGTIALGAIQVQTGGAFAGSAPGWLTHLMSPKTKTLGIIGLPPPVVIWIVVGAAMQIFVHRTVSGRRLLATGANPRAAGNSLINTRRVWTLSFAFSGAVAALVGVLVAGYAGSVDGSIGDPYLFGSVVAVIVGGTVFGGPGDYVRTMIGALFLTVVNFVLVGKGANQAIQDIVYGLAILIAVSLYGRERSLRDHV